MIKESQPAYLRSAAAAQVCTQLHRASQDVLGGVAGRKLKIAFTDRRPVALNELDVVERNVLIELQFEQPNDAHHSIVVMADAAELAVLFALTPAEDGEALTADSLLRLGDIISTYIDTLVGELTWLQPAPRAWLANLEPIEADPGGLLRCDMPRSLGEESVLYAMYFAITTDTGEMSGMQVIIGQEAEQALLGLDQPADDAAVPPQRSARGPHQAMEATPTRQQPTVQPVQFKPLGPDQPMGRSNSIDLIRDVPLKVSVELGHASLTVREVLALGAGSVVELDRLAGEPVDVLVNDRLIARGEVVIVDESFGVRITDIVRESGLRGAS